MNAFICLPVQAGVTYSWGGSMRLAGKDDTGQFFLYFFSGAGCTGTVLKDVVGPYLQSNLVDPTKWYFLPSPDTTAPPSAMSVYFAPTAETILDAPTLDWDNVYFGPQGTSAPTVPSVPALSRGALFVLFLAIATVGFRLASAS